MTATTRSAIIAANRYGLADRARGEYTSWYTPTLTVAYQYGLDGINLADQPDVNGYRYGNIPNSGISHNYADDTSERGLSLAALDGCKPVGSVIWFADRPIVNVTGLLCPVTGSDGEHLVLAYGLADYDN